MAIKNGWTISEPEVKDGWTISEPSLEPSKRIEQERPRTGASGEWGYQPERLAGPSPDIGLQYTSPDYKIPEPAGKGRDP